MTTKIDHDQKMQGNFRLSAKMIETLKEVSQALNMSQADFLEFLFWKFGEEAAKMSKEQVIDLTAKVSEKLRSGRAQLTTPRRSRE